MRASRSRSSPARVKAGNQSGFHGGGIDLPDADAASRDDGLREASCSRHMKLHILDPGSKFLALLSGDIMHPFLRIDGRKGRSSRESGGLERARPPRFGTGGSSSPQNPEEAACQAALQKGPASDPAAALPPGYGDAPSVSGIRSVPPLPAAHFLPRPFFLFFFPPFAPPAGNSCWHLNQRAAHAEMSEKQSLRSPRRPSSFPGKGRRTHFSGKGPEGSGTSPPPQ